MPSKITIKRSITSIPPSGLSFGELAFIQGAGNTANQLYIGISGGSPVFVGAQIENTVSDWTSVTKLASQNAINNRISSFVLSGPTGPTGPTGDPGVTGPTGVLQTGPTGPPFNGWNISNVTLIGPTSATNSGAMYETTFELLSYSPNYILVSGVRTISNSQLLSGYYVSPPAEGKGADITIQWLSDGTDIITYKVDFRYAGTFTNV